MTVNEKNFTLYLDIGNSEIKWQAHTDKSVKHCPINELSLASELYQAMQQADDNYICCTKHHPQYAQLQTLLQDIPTQWISAVPTPPTFSLIYNDSSTYGIDRYLSLMAMKHHAPLILVSCGSALTVDMMSDSKHHIGGWIMPGLSSAKQQFGQYGLPIPTQKADVNALGTDTHSALANGYHSMIINFLTKLERAPASYGLTYPKLIITGGDSRHLLPDLSSQWQHEENLVLRGLKMLSSTP